MAHKKDGHKHGPIANARQSIARIGIEAMGQILRKEWPDNDIVKVNSTTLRMRCPMPNHQERSGSCNWNFSRGFVKCFGCGYYQTDFFMVMRDAKGMHVRDSIELAHAFCARLFTDKDTKELDARYDHVESMRILSAVFNRFMFGCMQPLPGSARYTEALVRAATPTLEWLFKERRHLEDQASSMPYGIVPPAGEMEKMVSEVLTQDLEHQASLGRYPAPEWRKRIEDRCKELTKGVTADWTYCVAFTYGVSVNEPSCFKLRKPSDAKGIMYTPCHDDQAPQGFFGLYSQAFLGSSIKDSKQPNLHVVEGENDALTAMERLQAEMITGVHVVAGGGSAVHVKILVDAGYTHARVIADHDAGGEVFIQHCLAEGDEVVVDVFDAWPKVRECCPPAHDPDEAILGMGLRQFYAIAFDPSQFNRNYLSAAQWATHKFDEQRASKSPGELCSLAATYGRYVVNPAERSRYVTDMAARIGIREGPLYNAIAQTADTPQKFRLQLTHKLNELVFPLFVEVKGRSQVLHVWHAATKTEIQLVMHDGESMAKSLCVVYGNFYDNFICNLIGLPRFMTGPDGVDLNTMPGVEAETVNTKKLYDYLKLAAEDLVKDVPYKSACDHHGQGQHRLADPANPGAYACYVVNGNNVYKGVPEAGREDQLQWTTLRGPRDGNYLFRVSSAAWSKEITDENDLVQGNAVSKEDLRQGLRVTERVLSHWRLRSQELDAKFLAAHLMAVSVPCAFDAKVGVSIVGDVGSGKSTLLAMFGGGKAASLRLIEMSTLMESYSGASVYQKCDRSSLSICLDEFEDSGDMRDAKGKTVAELQTHLRTMINEGGAYVNRGSADPTMGVTSYHLMSFLITSSVLRSRLAADDSRRIYIQTRKIASQVSPEVAAFQPGPTGTTKADYERVRRMLTIGTLHLAEELRRNAVTVKQELSRPSFLEGKPYRPSARFLDCLVPALSVMQALGEDWRGFAEAICDERATLGDFDAAAQPSAAAELRDALLYSPAIQMAANARSCLRLVDVLSGSSEDWDILNHTGSGVYVMADKQLIVINWATVQAKGGILDKAQYPRTTTKNLKHQFDQDPLAIRQEEMALLKVPEFVTTVGDGWRQDLFSAYDVSQMIDKYQKAKQQQATRDAKGEHAAGWKADTGGSGNIN